MNEKQKVLVDILIIIANERVADYLALKKVNEYIRNELNGIYPDYPSEEEITDYFRSISMENKTYQQAKDGE